MSSKKMSLASAISISIAGVLLVASLFFPWWGMNFIAPQYPEGLDIVVYPNKLKGNIDIINGLNHYIGMKPISEKSIPELAYLPHVIGLMALFTFVVAFVRKKSWLYVLIAVFVIGGALGIYDIHRWLVDFGTNLDDNAPIKIEPFVPPIWGENRIANFITNSYFTTGSYIVGIAFLCLLFPLWKERKK
jgi:copper chaperone NosL